MSHEKEHKEQKEEQKERPIYGPKLEIVPVKDKKTGEEDVKSERQLIDGILNKKMPWVHQSWKERG